MKVHVDRGGKSVWVGFAAPVGSRDEADSVKGVSHFVEHMLFKGTKTRTKNQITEELERYGATLNAYTGEEITVYWANIASKYQENARVILKDMVTDAILPEDEFEKEKKVIVQELKMYEDNPSYSIYDLARKALFNKSSGLYLPVIGTKETLKNMVQKDLKKHYEDNYKVTPEIIVGNTGKNITTKAMSQRFSVEDFKTETSSVIKKQAGITQATMALTGGFHIGDSIVDDYALKLFSGVMGGFSGRFFQVIREKHNLVYTTYFFVEKLSCGTCQWYAYAKLNAENIELAQKLMLEELTRPVTKEELNFSKDKVIGELELALDNNITVGNLIAKSITKGVDYNEHVVNYAENIDRGYQNFYKLLERIDFNKSRLVSIVPKK